MSLGILEKEVKYAGKLSESIILLHWVETIWSKFKILLVWPLKREFLAKYKNKVNDIVGGSVYGKQLMNVMDASKGEDNLTIYCYPLWDSWESSVKRINPCLIIFRSMGFADDDELMMVMVMVVIINHLLLLTFWDYDTFFVLIFQLKFFILMIGGETRGVCFQ